jgi:proline dehydrogenase
VAGDTLDDAMRMAVAAKARGHAVTLGYWHGEDEPAEAVAERYLASLTALAKAGVDAHLAMKVPGLRSAPELIATVVAEARNRGIAVDIDAHAPEQAEADYAAAEAVGPEGMGVAVPGRWRAAPDLAERAMALGLRVRVVKGMWEDPTAPKLDPAEGYLAVIDRLAGRAREVGVASHAPALAAEALKRLAAAGTRAEQELLYGLPMAAPAAEGRRAGVKTRVYIPYGSAWIPYSLRRALKSPGTVVRLATDLATGNRDGLPPPA